ncbi:acetolactate decarboxylase [Deinococcus sp. QL22]|uniref:acetolactate decarboxylase n=1 Tax=Deinococcus sp. QL22 TaxID=2939437 RepID=UPI00201755A5|nr:acetolactate decarboxylase [Deinococcus sp. QL22]UQN08706.1 acetolactate decarboxylase [Deinococcus sp. QL22]
MVKKTLYFALTATLLLSTASADKSATLYQVSSLNALSVGLFQGALPIGLLKREGNFGLGTYDGIDGEMIVLDGHVYHARADGSVTESRDDELASFAAVVDFIPERQYSIRNMTMKQLDAYIASLISSENYFYAIRIQGTFFSVTNRAIAKLSLPYPTLAQAVQQQVTFNRADFPGTAVVLRSPQYVSNLNVAGNHYHFISEDLTFGGHALDLHVDQATLQIQEIRRATLELPHTSSFQKTSLPPFTK